ncbi:hypothetical protein GLGCALEP_04368 [Pseudomonas sp. MM221]|nr:hypothetical protein DBADOPDK_04259 [Pseudomonas sp. MM223]CAI3807205.1 hypothetical protein GLGCALEP_04368 [Pseudomonas sp. MM221]
MLKMVPDPPHTLHSLEDTLIQAAEHAVCALAISQQAMVMQPKSPAAVLMMATTHELDSLRLLLESALLQAQVPNEPRMPH